MSDFPRPAPCPRCQQDMIWPGRIRLMMRPSYYAVECPCGWSGPVANTEVNAAIRWNQRSEECWLEFEEALRGR